MFFFLGLHFLLVKALPLENQLQQASQNHTLLWDTIVTGWSDDPSFRGTSSILWSCLVTIVASVYTAIHVNIPLNHMTQWDRFKGKAKWAFVALIAPELVLQAAFIQRRDARKLIRELERIDEQALSQDPSSNAKQDSNEHNKTRPNIFTKCWQRLKSLEHRREARSKSDFNMAYGFWVVMGGFVAETTNIHGDHNRVSLTTHGVALLAEHGYRIPLPKEQVADRSKASALAKSLVCIQVLWLLLQVFVRLAAEYPLTLLEVHATVHVVCALCIYILWWHKPLDVDEPIVIDFTSYEDIMAYMLMDSLSTEQTNWPPLGTKLVRSTKYHCEDDPAAFHFRQPELNLLILDTTMLLNEIKELMETSATNSSDVQGRIFHDSLIQSIQKVQDPAVQQLEKAFISMKPVIEDRESEKIALGAGAFHPCGFAFDSAVEVSLEPITIRRWILCIQALARPGFIDQRRNNKTTRRWRIGKHKSDKKSKMHDINNIVKGWRIGESKREYFVGTRMTSGEIIGSSLELTFASIPFHIATLLLPLLYGGIHLAARNTHFPSATESLLWEISALAVMVFVPSCYLFLMSCFIGIWVMTSISEFMTTKVPSHFSPRSTGRVGRISRAIFSDDLWNGIGAVLFIVAPLILMLSMFSLSRLYLVVESFISLRAIPLGALAATPWVQSIPHL